MADTQVLTTDTEAVKRWAKVLTIEAARHMYFAKFMKENDANSIIELRRDLEGQSGDQITFMLSRKLSGSGVSGDEQLEGNEEQLNRYSDTVTLDQRRNAVRLKGRLSERRTAWDQEMEAKGLLKIWMAETLDDDIFTQFSSATASDRVLYGGNATAVANIGSDDTVTPTLFDRAIAKAKKTAPKIWPVRVEGQDVYVILLHTDVAYDLRQNFSSTALSWVGIQQYANVRGKDNPLFLGALGFWGGSAVVHEHEKVPTATNGGAAENQPWATNMFFGRQAGSFAWGARPEAWQKEFDYGNKKGFAVGAIWGFTKNVYNNLDFAFMELRTYRTNN